MAQQQLNTDVDPQSLTDARSTWHGFTTLVKYSCIAIAVLLVLMATFLV